MRRGYRWVSIIFAAALLAPLGVPGGVPAGATSAEGETTRVSLHTDDTEGDGNSTVPAVNGDDGLFVTFESEATDLVDGDTNGMSDVFVRNRETGETERVSVASDGSEATGGGSHDPAISDDGRFVAFESDATDLVGADGNGATDVFVHDRQDGTTERVSVHTDGTEGDDASSNPAISDDGRFVAFESDATDLVDDDTNAMTDVFVHDRQEGTTERVSVADDGSQAMGGASTDPSVDADGDTVAFQSDATNLVDDDTDVDTDVFVRDLADGSTTLASASTDGEQGDGADTKPSISDGGHLVAFHADSTNLVEGDDNGLSDVFVSDLAEGTTERVSVASDGTQADGGDSTEAAIGGDGRFVAFQSGATNLVEDDTNGLVDIFRHDRVSGKTIRVSVSSQANGTSANAAIDDDGDTVAFDSGATNLVEGDSNGVFDVFVRHVIPRADGYLVLDQVGGIFTFGEAEFFGSLPGLRRDGVPVGDADGIDIAVTTSGEGYTLLDEAGGIHTFGDAEFFGSIPGLREAGVSVGPAMGIDIATTPTGEGYVILDEVGGIHTFGDAEFFGSIPGLRAEGVPVGDAEAIDVNIAPSGEGYTILDAEGGIHTFGDASFHGSLPQLREDGVAVGDAAGLRMELTPSGDGYLILDRQGGIHTFGDASFHGSLPGLREAGVSVGDAPGVDFGATPTGDGYLVLDEVGGIHTFGDAEFFGSVPALRDAGVSIGQAESIRVELVVF